MFKNYLSRSCYKAFCTLQLQSRIAGEWQHHSCCEHRPYRSNPWNHTCKNAGTRALPWLHHADEMSLWCTVPTWWTAVAATVVELITSWLWRFFRKSEACELNFLRWYLKFSGNMLFPRYTRYLTYMGNKMWYIHIIRRYHTYIHIHIHRVLISPSFKTTTNELHGERGKSFG